MNETASVQKQDINSLLSAIGGLRLELKLIREMLEWRFRDDPKPVEVKK